MLRRLRDVIVLALVTFIVYLVIIVVLLLSGAVSLTVFLLLLVIAPIIALLISIIALPLFVIGLIIPILVIAGILLAIHIILAFVLTIIVLWVGNKAFSEALGVNLIPFSEDGSIVWWRIILAIIIFISIYSLIARLSYRVREERRGLTVPYV
ncbi:MAG: hypothetical protein QXR02_03900 [Acidilobaceae archaeon]